MAFSWDRRLAACPREGKGLCVVPGRCNPNDRFHALVASTVNFATTMGSIVTDEILDSKEARDMYELENELRNIDALTLTIPQTARLLGISISKTYEAARMGQLPTIRVGTRVLVSRRRLEELIDGRAS
jgi:excisionase family DNA binding protein